MKVTLFTPHFGQKKIIDGFADSDHKFGVVSCGRQFGKSLLGQNLMLYWLLKTKNQKGAWISPIYNQAKKIFQELSNAANALIVQSNKADLTMTFVNGSTLQFLSAERYDSIRGYSFNYIVVDEAAFIREEAMNEAIYPTLSAIGKKCLIISTPKSKNWFYSTFLKGLDQGSDFISFRGISTDNPHISQTFINEQSKSLPTQIFKQEYLAEFSEATNDVFRGLDNVCILNEWEEPQRNKQYYFGLDVGLSNDYTVCTILDESGRTARILRFNGKSIADAGKDIVTTLRRYNVKGGYIETNNIGQAIYELVRSENIKCKGYTTTQESKQLGVRKLMEDIENGAIMLPSLQLMSECYDELSAYTYRVSANGKLSFSHPTGYHDDIVDSIWLANLSRIELGFSRNKIYIGGLVKQNQYV